MSDQETSKISRYLLGELPREEMDALEARLLTESGLFDLAEAVEDEVVDRYVRGEMSREEARRFERRLLPSERIQERVAFARALASRHTAAQPLERERRLAPVIPLFRSPARLAWAATLVALLAAGVLAFEVARLRSGRTELERSHAAAVAQMEDERRSHEVPAPAKAPSTEDEATEELAGALSAARERIAELEARDAATAERRTRRPREIGDPVATATVFLTLATRAGAAPTTLASEELSQAERVELQLDLDGGTPQEPLSARVLRGSEPVWQTRQVQVITMDGESMARIELPRESLLEGRYRIELAQQGEDGKTWDLLGSYELSVAR